ncbi:TPA: PH domain-containing protein [Burkholderia cenocepacia]|uniref:PH domain-containing protein n=1 Tax=Burkholderia vietnamiensis TaxID=60552 RepID=A0ABS1AXJ8_BURVI|nr:PH domain-containing protein [Burkholderia vietnamiensis]MBJ9688834.1 PH domain-containing protein [Burkholderia vietnamiensis]
MQSAKGKGRQVFNSYNGEQPPVYAKADASRQLSFVPSLFVCIPAMFRTWMLLLVIVASYGLFMHRATDFDPQPSPAKHARAQVHKPSTPAPLPLSGIPSWCYFAAAGGVVLLRFGWGMLASKSRSITIEPARLTFRRGVLNREVRSLEMTRVKNVSSYQRWWQRPFGIGTVSIESTDWGNRMFLMEGMTDPHELRERILRAGVASRQFYGTTETWVSVL